MLGNLGIKGEIYMWLLDRLRILWIQAMTRNVISKVQYKINNALHIIKLQQVIWQKARQKANLVKIRNFCDDF
jgi:hypothetical protein